MQDRVEFKEFDFTEVKGLSKSQLMQHYKLYIGYVKNINKIWNIESQLDNFDDANTTYSEIRCLKLGETYALDGVKLHELYFQNLGGGTNKVYGSALELIRRDFGNYERWKKYFKSVGKSMRGWVVLAIDHIDEKLHIFGSDAHDVGAVWNSWPVLVMDVYEHAYMIDFGIDRNKYIDVFMDNINWDIVNKRIKEYYLMYTRHDDLLNSDWKRYCY